MWPGSTSTETGRDPGQTSPAPPDCTHSSHSLLFDDQNTPRRRWGAASPPPHVKHKDAGRRVPRIGGHHLSEPRRSQPFRWRCTLFCSRGGVSGDADWQGLPAALRVGATATAPRRRRLIFPRSAADTPLQLLGSQRCRGLCAGRPADGESFSAGGGGSLAPKGRAASAP